MERLSFLVISSKRIYPLFASFKFLIFPFFLPSGSFHSPQPKLSRLLFCAIELSSNEHELERLAIIFLLRYPHSLILKAEIALLSSLDYSKPLYPPLIKEHVAIKSLFSA